VYDQSGGYLAFVVVYSGGFVKGEMSIRLFSKSICRYDTIVINGGSPTSIVSIERIRK
jgi:hypothetical protein